MPTDLPPGYTGNAQDPVPAPEPDKPVWTGLASLIIVCATVVAIVWLLTR